MVIKNRSYDGDLIGFTYVAHMCWPPLLTTIIGIIAPH